MYPVSLYLSLVFTFVVTSKQQHEMSKKLCFRNTDIHVIVKKLRTLLELSLFSKEIMFIVS